MACRKMSMSVGAIAARRPISCSPVALYQRHYSSSVPPKEEEIKTETHTGQVKWIASYILLCKHYLVSVQIFDWSHSNGQLISNFVAGVLARRLSKCTFHKCRSLCQQKFRYKFHRVKYQSNQLMAYVTHPIHFQQLT